MRTTGSSIRATRWSGTKRFTRSSLPTSSANPGAAPISCRTPVCQGGHMTRAQLDKRPGDVAAMFDKVAPRYDLLNDVLSFGQDRWWRKVVAKAVGAQAGERVLDLAAGTGTSSVTFTDAGAACVACDFSLGMLRAGVERLGAQDARGRPPGSGAAEPGRAGAGAMSGPVRFVAGDALRLPFG